MHWVADPGLGAVVSGHAMSTLRRRHHPDAAEISCGGDAYDRHVATLRCRHVGVAQGRIVGDHVDAPSGRDRAELAAVVVDVEGDELPFGARREHDSVALVECDATRAATAIRPLRQDRPLADIDGERDATPQVTEGTPAYVVDDQ